MKIERDLDNTYIKKNGGTTTTNIIPFSQGLSSGYNILFDAQPTAALIFTEGSQRVLYDDGANIAEFYPYNASESGMAFFAAGKCKVYVDTIQATLFTASGVEFSLPCQMSNTLLVQGATDIDARLTGKVGSGNDHMGVGGCFLSRSSSVSNSGTTETDLHSHTVQGNGLSVDEDSLEFEFIGTTANNLNNKTLKVYWAGTAILDTAAQPEQAGSWRVFGRVVRTGANTQKIWVSLVNSGGMWSKSIIYTTGTATLSNNQILKVTGTSATAGGDITCEMSYIDSHPVAK